MENYQISMKLGYKICSYYAVYNLQTVYFMGKYSIIQFCT